MKKIFPFLAVFSIVSVCSAVVITVDDDGPADFNNIQAAINDANNGDTIIVQPGTYTGNGNRDIDFLGKAITVRSADPNDPCVVEATIIDCNGTEENPHRGFHFHSSEDVNSILNGVIIINGYATHDLGSAGGAIYCENGSSPKIINCIITGNEATSWPLIGGGSGGAVFGYNGEISNCLISENSAMFGGGLSECAGIIRNNIITNNKAYYLGGGLCGCNGIIHDNVISHNYAGGHGGGLASCNNIIRNCIVWGNTGGQLYQCGANVTYSDIQDGYTGMGNINNDPCFAGTGTGDFHLKSQAGRWNPNTQSWVKDGVTSPCIDAGDPNSDWKAELWPHGKRINMGAYGGTPQASMSLSTAGNIADLDNDDNLDFNDVKLFTEKWLYQEVLLAADLSRNGDVNFMDFAIFGNEWSRENAEPGITYQISPCGGGLLAVEELDTTGFTVTVNGHYIHFEDMMVANCCTGKLELAMEVYGNQIIIYEREFLGPYPCTCVCDYPVTADLGPFVPGSYILSVYIVHEVWEWLIGTTTVIIE